MADPTNFVGTLSVNGAPIVPGAGVLVPYTVGTTFFVDSVTGSAGNDGKSPTKALATIAAAIALCTANKGDVIILLPTHAESLSGAAAIALNVAGVSIIGLGRGSNRPTLTFHTTDATFAISAANCLIRNIRVTSDVDEMVKMFHITAAYVTLDKVDHFETASAQTIQFILTTNAADFLEVRNCYHYQVNAAAAAQAWIQLVGIDGGIIEDCTFRLTLSNNAASVTISGTTACLGTVVRRNTITQLGGTTQVSAILFVDSSTGVHVHDNRVAVGSTALAGGVDVGNAGYANENYTLNTADKSGIIDPVADS
jgi:hypothetical protein